ncbi:MAG: hypothetical protein ACOC2E_06755 [Bacteroidota bacterium]
MQKRLGYFIDLLSKAGSSNFTPNFSKLKREISNLETEIYFIISDHQLSKKEKKQSISTCIGLLSHFMDRLHEMPPPISDPDKTHVKELLLRLVRFIHGLELKARPYFDYKLITPDFIIEELKRKFKSNQANLNKSLLEFGIREDLVKVSLEPFEKLLSKNKKIPFRRYFYLMEYQNWLQDFVHGTIHFGEHECDLIKLLISKNLNSRNFQSFLVKFINDKIDHQSTAEERLKALMRLKLCLPEITPSKNLWYTSKNRSTLEIFKETLLLSIEFYENELKPLPFNTIHEQPPSYESLHPVKTNLKVSHLAILCRLLFDDGHILDASCTDLTNAIASAFKLKNSEPISQLNLRNKFYSQDLKSLYEFKEMLNSWSKRIDHYTYNLKYK